MRKYIITNQEDVTKMSNLIGNYDCIEIAGITETEIVLGKAIALPLYIINSRVSIENYCYSDVEIRGKSIVHITSSGLRCKVCEESIVFCATGNFLQAYGNAFIYCGDKCSVSLYERAFGFVSGYSIAFAYGESRITASGNSTVKLYDSSRASVKDNACVEVFGKNKVDAFGNARVITHNKEAAISHINSSLIIEENLYNDASALIQKHFLYGETEDTVTLYCLVLKIEDQLFSIRGDKKIDIGETVKSETLYTFSDIENQVAEFFTYNSNAIKNITVLKCTVNKADIRPLIPSVNPEDGILVKKFIAADVIPINSIGKIGERIAAASVNAV